MCARATTNVQFFWRDRGIHRDFRTGVSLHSHTMYSEETLEMVPRYTAKLPYLARLIRGRLEQFKRNKGFEFDFANAFWTPPLAPRQAYRVEEKQIQRQFQLPGLVSLTDHDDIRAGSLLQVLERFRTAPISTEWTIPFESTFFHLGVHNLPVMEAQSLMKELRVFTANPQPKVLDRMLNTLNSYPDVLLVLNHPLWDEKGIGAANHAQSLHRLLRYCGSTFHALEVNGLRPWKENREVLRLGRQMRLPVLAGGDRHGREPNAILNLSRASTFPEFVDEVRNHHFSQLVFMPQYRYPLRVRILRTILDIMREYPENVKGRRSWSDRVFYREPGSAEPISVTAVWNGNLAMLTSA